MTFDAIARTESHDDIVVYNGMRQILAHRDLAVLRRVHYWGAACRLAYIPYFAG